MDTTSIPEYGQSMDPPAVFHKNYISFSTDDYETASRMYEIITEALPEEESGIVYALYAKFNQLSDLSFGTALAALKAGYAVRLPHWGEDVVIRLQRPDEGSKMTHPYLYVESRYGKVPWKETFVELLSEEWMLAYDPDGNKLW